tara:strand:+ start:439 stop:645 length:207 start_codon:yes stop_codon:yes gene_type:complete
MNIETPKEAVLKMRGAGMTQREIVAALKLEGVATTQETISRIGSGAIKSPSYMLAIALMKLAAFSEVA